MDEYESGIYLWKGEFSKYMEVGMNWKLPILHSLSKTDVVTTTMTLTTQTLTTADNASVIVSSVVKYDIFDIKPYLLEMSDAEDVIVDVVKGSIRKVVADHPYSDLNTEDIEKTIVKLARKYMRPFGVNLQRVTFTDVGRIKTLRLLQE